ncbi:O-antigen ligase family protein [Granulosicoccus sp. 3-233]|uniref:O-antigen ligase family protein n=1 Tax=Granulosicoccus sp. 3-233 TaxID=3417969 RepID=UPI003D32E880
MASTNPFQSAEDEFPEDGDMFGKARRQRRSAEAGEPEVDRDARPGLRGAGGSSRVQRKASRRARRIERVESEKIEVISGWPKLEGLKPVLMFLSMPAVLVMAITLTGGNWPSSILYPIALGLGLIVGLSALKGVELVLACMIIYLPFSKVFVVPLAPGVNGTNMLVLLGLFAALLRASTLRQKLNDWPPGTALVAIFGVVTALSVVTISLLPGGRTYFLYNEILSYKAWIDQFIFYFIVLMCVRDVESAKRCVVYMLIGSVLVVLYSVPEMLEKMGRSTIEKSRIEGPHLQSNNFGGFVAYTLLPLVAIFFIYIKDLRAWLLTPYFLLTAKVLITTFSRGAYLAMVAGGFMAGWFKGRGFLAFWLTLVMCFLLVFPSLIPDSILARMDSLTHPDADSSIPEEEKLDKSSETRLVMWRAGAQMILESPVLGKGFKGFPYLKEDYTEIAVKESDPHSMYLYIGSQMGLPALALFLLILGYSFNLGRLHASNEQDRFIKAIGIGGAAATACYAVVCVFGSRAVSLNFTAYFWAYLVVMQVLKQKMIVAEAARNPVADRTNAFADSGNGTRGDRRARSAASDEPEPDLTSSVRCPRTGRRTGMRGAAAFQAASMQTEAESTGQSASVDEPEESAGIVSSRLRSKLRRNRGKGAL